MSEAVDKMIGEACRVYAETGMRKASSGSITAALLTLGIPLETLAELKAETWVAVPREPTEAQCAAGLAELPDEVWQEDITVTYRAMLSAAPTKPEA